MTYTKLLTQKKTSHKIVIQGKSMNIQHVIDLLNRAELYDEASDVLIMAEQNKELLEALKKLHNVAVGSVELGDWDELQDALDCAIDTIIKTEGTE